MKIARVFPRHTAMTPDDELAFVDCPPPMLILPEIDEVHISVAFSWDKARAEQLAEMWRAVGVPVTVGGRAYRDPGGDFVPGMYIKKGAVITSRGCDGSSRQGNEAQDDRQRLPAATVPGGAGGDCGVGEE